MTDEGHTTRRCILGVFAHPDDETSGCAGTLATYARDGVEIYIATATRGELGELGTGEFAVTREDLPAVRESELRDVLELLGAYPPFLLGYRDQEVSQADIEGLIQRILAIMTQTAPDIVITFGPSGISNHPDHKAIHRAACMAFHRYRHNLTHEPRLYYVALPHDVAQQFDFTLDDTEMQISIAIDISDVKPLKLQALRTYRSQQDAQELAELLETGAFSTEWFHQAYPPLAPDHQPVTDFWDNSRT